MPARDRLGHFTGEIVLHTGGHDRLLGNIPAGPPIPPEHAPILPEQFRRVLQLSPIVGHCRRCGGQVFCEYATARMAETVCLDCGTRRYRPALAVFRQFARYWRATHPKEFAQ
jgi:hypothetical protein